MRIANYVHVARYLAEQMQFFFGRFGLFFDHVRAVFVIEAKNEVVGLNY